MAYGKEFFGHNFGQEYLFPKANFFSFPIDIDSKSMSFPDFFLIEP